MNNKDRVNKIQEIIDSGNTAGSKRIMYKNDTNDLPAYRIPVEYLIFNQYNGRIGTWVKTHEKLQGTCIDASTPEGEELIIDFLWKSKEVRNKQTMKDIEEKGQLEVGIVTKDGVVIDGNRRSMLLKKIDTKNGNAPTYFNAVILEDKLSDNPKEIRKLETTYQLGADHAVDYNAIEKYLKCKELFEEDKYTAKEIGKMMSDSPAKIEEYLSILALMERFLKSHGYEGIYTYLTEINAEGPFVDLNNYLNKYKGVSGKIKGRDWAQQPSDIADLEQVYFDYIRAGYGTHKIRCIGNTASEKGITKGFFNNKAVWDEFMERYTKNIEPANNEEKSLDKLREERPSEKTENLMKGRDNDWKNTECENEIKLSDNLKKNLHLTNRSLDDLSEEMGPFSYMKRAISALSKVDETSASFEGDEIENSLLQIKTYIWNFQKELKKRNKQTNR